MGDASIQSELAANGDNESAHRLQVSLSDLWFRKERAPNIRHRLNAEAASQLFVQFLVSIPHYDEFLAAMLERAPSYDLVQYVHRVSKAIASAMVKRTGSTTSQAQEMALPLAVKELPVGGCSVRFGSSFTHSRLQRAQERMQSSQQSTQYLSDQRATEQVRVLCCRYE